MVQRLVRFFIACTLLALSAQSVGVRRAAALNAPAYVLLSEPSAGKDPLVTLIGEAQASVLVETEALTDPAIAAALSTARSHGVDVRVMVDPHSASSGPVLISLSGNDILIRRGNPAFRRTALTDLMIDGSTLALSNAPLTEAARKSQRRLVRVDFNQTDVQQASSVFFDDWERRTPVILSSNAVIGPVNYAQNAVAAIDRAVVNLDIMAQTLTSPSIAQAIVAAVHRGVSVRVMLDPAVPASVVQSILQDGASIRLLNIGFAGSAIAVDNARLLLGSPALDDDSLQQDRQMGLLIKDVGVSAVFASTFGIAWRAAAPIAEPTASPTSTPVPTGTNTPIPTRTPIPTKTPKGYRPTKTPTPRPLTPTHTPVPSRTPTALRATATPTAAATPSALSISVDYAQSVRIGSTQQIVVHTIAGASVSIIVTYPDGTVTNAGTRAGIADAKGTFTDSWPISLTVNPGPAKVAIVVTAGKLKRSAAINFTITF